MKTEETKQQLIFTRQLGHKENMPGSGQWRMIDDDTQDCWVCDRVVYSLIFWNEEIGQFLVSKVDQADQEYLVTKIEEFKSEASEPVDGQSESTKPLIYGEFTNWKG